MAQLLQQARTRLQSAVRDGTLSRAVARLLPSPATAGDAPTRRAVADAVVDCAVYVRGQRLAGSPTFADAAGQARWRRHAFVWLGLHDPDPVAMAAVGRVFGLDELTVARALADGHRPGLDRQGDVTVLVLRTARYVEHAEITATSEIVETGDVMVIVGERFVITVRHGAAGALTPVRADLEHRPAVLAEGPWSVAYAVAARMVGLYLEVADQVEQDLDAVEEAVFAHDRRQEVQHLYQLKRELVEFKRAVTPLHAPLRHLVEDGAGLVGPRLVRYFTDVEQRLARAGERVAAFDELLNTVMQARLAQVAIEQNNDMRKIASWAAIAAAQTGIAGVYGMNFAFMPETQWRYGYFAALAAMALAAVTLHRWFRRSGWL